MKPTCIMMLLAALSLCPRGVVAEDSFSPLDTKTRCLVLVRKCLVLIAKKDVEGIFQNIADGHASDFRLYPDLDALPADLKQELEDVDRFFAKNFRAASILDRSFDAIQFSALVTAEEPVFVTSTAKDRQVEAKLHSMKFKIKDPETGHYKIGELSFVQTADTIYWVPIGW